MKVLDELKMPYAHDQSHDGLKDKSNLRWDFRILADEPLFIEYDGEFHYFHIRKGGMTQQEAQYNLESTQRRDKIKDDYCEDNGLLLLRIPYWDKGDIKQLVSEFVNDNVL